MKVAPLPPHEHERLAELQRYRVLDTLPEQYFDDFTRLAAQLCQVPIAAISLIDQSRQWFKSKIGLAVSETSRAVAFCSHTILKNEVFEVSDSSKDSRF
ncbi:hypothetical protein WDW86_15265 [Bdellovibrionota bacterium FG-2]